MHFRRQPVSSGASAGLTQPRVSGIGREDAGGGIVVGFLRSQSQQADCVSARAASTPESAAYANQWMVSKGHGKGTVRSGSWLSAHQLDLVLANIAGGQVGIWNVL